ncbi:hypothetical protein AVEN_146918-1 [Araneus ventricosus]|uniref:Uncharacterized protein n=1 Tax=Araneus ventricosus TaxID=182803 RepID=A0A4Y2WDB7_ARAVE|nr:hypothetical protein AVEN_146918-1 [Araneus ventricosus]
MNTFQRAVRRFDTDHVNKILLDISMQLLFNVRQTLNIPNRPQRLNTTHYKSTTINLLIVVFPYASVLVNILKTHLRFRRSLYSGCSIQELAGMARESIEHIPLHSGNHGRPVVRYRLWVRRFQFQNAIPQKIRRILGIYFSAVLSERILIL